MDRYSDRDALHGEHRVVDSVTEVGLRQNDDRLRAAFPRGRDVALQPTKTEVVVEAGEQEREVHVGRKHLIRRVVAGVLAHEGAASSQDRRDDGAFAVRAGNRDPVADSRNRPADLVLVEQSAGRPGA